MIIELQSQTQLDEILRKYKYVVLVFYAKWCFPSRGLLSLINQIHEELYWCVFVLIDVDRFPDLARQYGVTGTPTRFYVYNGKIIGSDIGSEKDAETLKTIIIGIYKPYRIEEERREMVIGAVVITSILAATGIGVTILKRKR